MNRASIEYPNPNKYICQYENCFKYFEDPILLPCNTTICKTHLNDLYASIKNNNTTTNKIKFVCVFCNNEHQITNFDNILHDFDLNLDFIDAINSNQHLNGKQLETKLLNDKLSQLLKEFNHMLNNTSSYLSDYFNNIRQSIESRRNDLKSRIDSIANNLLNQLDAFELDCMSENNFENNGAKSFDTIKLDEMLTQNFEVNDNELNEYLVEKWRQDLRVPKLNEKKLLDLTQKIEQKIKLNQIKLENFRLKILNEKLFQYSSIDIYNDLNENLFGKIVTNKHKPKQVQTHQTIKGHTSYVNCIKLFPEKNRLISCSSDFLIKIWDLDKTECISVLEGHSGPVYCIELLQAGNLISGSFDTTIKIWDLNTGKSLFTLKGHTFDINCLELFPNNQFLISGSSDKSIRLWSLTNYECISILKEHTSGVLGLVLNNSNGTLISCSFDTTIKIWNMEKCECIKTLHGHTSYVRVLKLLQNGNLISCSHDKTLKIWDLTKYVCLTTLEDDSPILCMKLFSNDLLVCGYASKYGRNIKIWNLDTKKIIKVLNGHLASVRCIELQPTKLKIYSCSEDKTIRIWDL